MRVQNYIGGQWVEAHSGAVFTSINPATEDPVAEVANSDTRDVEAAVEAAPRRGEILYRAGLRLLEQKEELAQLLTREMGKVIAEARGDVFTEWKAIYVDYSGKLQRAQIDNR